MHHAHVSGPHPTIPDIPLRSWLRGPIPWMLLVSLGCNVAALVIPFMDVRIGLVTEPYSLPRSVQLLWESGLYALAALIVGFSICFPLAKLLLLGLILAGVGAPSWRAKALAFVERFGKWSMLDVFMVALMLALADDQLLVAAEPRIGVVCFTVAIVLSMLGGELMSRRLHAGSSPEARALPAPSRFELLGFIGLGLVLLAALLLPCLQIDDWRLADRPVSIATAVIGLIASGSPGLGVILALFLVVAPLTGHAIGTWALSKSRRGTDHAHLVGRYALLRRWSMLDVFALALAIFLIEGESFIKTELTWGSAALAVLVATYGALALLAHRGRATVPTASGNAA